MQYRLYSVLRARACLDQCCDEPGWNVPKGRRRLLEVDEVSYNPFTYSKQNGDHWRDLGEETLVSVETCKASGPMTYKVAC